MQKVYDVGPDDCGAPIGDYLWVVCHYTAYDYEGSGEAVALRPDGKLDIYDLGHCSCYGPFDNGCDTVTVLEFFREPDSVHDPSYNELVVAKVRELLGM